MVVVKSEATSESKGDSTKIKGDSKKIKSENQKIKAEKKKINDDKEPVEKLTPYQGTRRTFGLFTCTKCSRQWSSAHSWANMGQECRTCRINVYPRRQWKLKKKRRPKDAEPGKNHQDKLCEKCKTIGFPCTLRARSDDAD